MTTDRERDSHLRLVFSAGQKPTGVRQQARRPTREQLTFPYPEGSAVFFIFVETMTRGGFAKIVSEFTPRWIFDVRAVPRLDTIAGSRQSAFHLFEKTKATYVDVFGQLGVKSYRSADSNPVIWGELVSELLRESCRKGPYLFLFDDETLLGAAGEVLPSIIKPVIGKKARFASIGSDTI